MKFKESDFLQYIDEISYELNKITCIRCDPNGVIKGPCMPNECYYIVDLLNNRVVHSDGFKPFLGYENEEISIEMVTECYHPEDSDFVKRLIISIVSQFVHKTFKKNCNIFNVRYRFKKKTRGYVKILSNTYIHKVSSSGKVISVLIKYTDVTFLGNQSQISWEVNPVYFDKASLEKSLFKAYHTLFTSREQDIIKEIFKGKTNQQISKDLNISLHTVATHRKNIFRKANCHSPSELILYCRNKGVLN